MDIITRGTKFYEGKNNTLYWTNNPYIIEMEAKNETSNLISTLLFKLLSNNGIPVHFICSGTNSISKRVRKANIINLNAIGRFVCDESFSKRYGIAPGIVFDDMVFELKYINKELKNPFISSSAAEYGLHIASYSDLLEIEEITYFAGDIIKYFFEECNLTLVDFKLKFGYDCQTRELLVCGDISDNNCHLLDENGKLITKNTIKNISNIELAYKKALKKF
ncbi:MAG: phosphoribosylaminoimidazolesuccinocarboxamide synthase [Clostridia bacterium]